MRRIPSASHCEHQQTQYAVTYHQQPLFLRLICNQHPIRLPLREIYRVKQAFQEQQQKLPLRFLELFFIVDDKHTPTTQYKGWSKNRITIRDAASLASFGSMAVSLSGCFRQFSKIA